MSPSVWQILLVVGIALLFFGPKRIPGLGKSLGEAIRGFKKGISEDAEIDVTDSVDNEQIKNTDSTEAQKQTQSEKDKA